MAEDIERPLSSAEMIRRAREDLADATKKTREGVPLPAPMEYSAEVTYRDPNEEKTWRDPVPQEMPLSRRDRRAREQARVGTPVPAPPPDSAPSAGRAAALVAGILVALIGFGLALAIGLANGGG